MRRVLGLLVVGMLARAGGCDTPMPEYCGSLGDLTVDPTGLGGGLDGFESPYLGHTGSWDGMGGTLGGGSKGPDMDKEVAMGLRWTFMPVYWSALEPDGPVDLSQGVPEAWAALDAFVMEAQERGLNVLMQAPVMGGNAGEPPTWAGRREEGKSAPLDMAAAARFAGQLAERYRPGGTLARQLGWGVAYGVRAWELDNEPDTYQVHWEDQQGDYAEFATGVAAAIRAADPEAVIVASAVSAEGLDWLEGALDASALLGSPLYQQTGVPYSVGPVADAVSFHVYEGLNHQWIDCQLAEVRTVLEAYTQEPGFEYAAPRRYWHTEGNYDFLGNLPEQERAWWRWQLMTRAFAAGVEKVNVMDVSELEQVSVGVYVDALPNPHPMQVVEGVVSAGTGWVFRHQEAGHQVYVAWAADDASSGATVTLPVTHASVTVRRTDGASTVLDAVNGVVTVDLPARGTDQTFAEPVMVLDR